MINEEKVQQSTLAQIEEKRANERHKESKKWATDTSLSHPIFKKIKSGANPIYVRSNLYFYSTSSDANTKEDQQTRIPRDSFKLVTWVITHSSLQESSKIIAARIASHFNRETGLICPSIQTICEETGYNTATVQKAIKLMESSGEWKILKMRSHDSEHSYLQYIPVAPHQESLFSGWTWIAERSQDFIDAEKKREDRKLAQKKKLEDRLQNANRTLDEYMEAQGNTEYTKITCLKHLEEYKHILNPNSEK